jgi:hypothetical protein
MWRAVALRRIREWRQKNERVRKRMGERERYLPESAE